MMRYLLLFLLFVCTIIAGCASDSKAVSYTHLDVYKRQYTNGLKRSFLPLLSGVKPEGKKTPFIHCLANTAVLSVPLQPFASVTVSR